MATNSIQSLLVFGILLISGVNTKFSEAVLQRYTIPCEPMQTTSCNGIESLEDIAVNLDQQIDVQINFTNQQEQLTANITFDGLNSLSIIGHSNSTTINCTESNSGLLLANITTLTLKNLTVTHCGARSKQSQWNRIYMSALTITHGKNVNIFNLIITRSRGLGLTILSHQEGGRVLVISSVFKENKLPQEHKTESDINLADLADRVRGGGGVFVDATQQLDPVSHTLFHFDDCTFENNTAYTRYYDFLYTDNTGKVQKGYGRGGGAYLSLGNGLKNIAVSFSNCRFTENNAFLGGGLSVKINAGSNHQTNVTVEITNTIFEHNGCNGKKRATGYGGGMHLNFETFNGQNTTNNHYIIRNVNFSRNCAQVGGGMFYFSSRQKLISHTNTVLLDECRFIHNRAHMGSAVNMMPDIFRRQSTGLTTILRFRNCLFFENTVFVNHTDSQQRQRTAGVGTIYVSLYDIGFEGFNCFQNNLGSAIYIVNGIADFSNTSAHFVNNTGLNGGAVALIGVASIKVGANEYRFENNTALFKGGAIYVLMIDNNDFTTSRSCFIQNYDDAPSPGNWSSSFIFTGNKARDDYSGHTIFATTLVPCVVVNTGTVDRPWYTVINITQVFSTRGIHLSLDQIATEGAHIISNNSTWQIIPGEYYSHKVRVQDDLHHDVRVSLRAMMLEKTTEVNLNPALSSVIGDKIQLIGKPGHRANITLQTLSLQKAYIKLSVELLDCPPGFKLHERACVCNVDAYVAIFKCNMKKLHTHLIPGFWAGLVSDESSPSEPELATTICPFCDYSAASNDSTGIVLPRKKSDLTDYICGKTRMGTLCGSCRENYTVHFHSPHYLCKPVDRALCKLGWLFFILSELLPVTVVFITVLLLNISFTSGAVNGFILFCQLINSMDIDASGIITINILKTFRDTISYTTQVYQVIYGFFNLDFFNLETLSFCLWNGASALDMLAIKYVTILYTLLLMIVVICIINKCGGNCLGKYCRITTVKTSVTHGISTFLIICYAQCIRVSLSLLISVELYVEQDSKLRPGTRVWYDGQMQYFGKEHLTYALPALLCLLTIGLIPPVLLLTYPLLNKVLDNLGFEDDSKIYALTRKLPILNSLKPLLDSFQGCFKDNLRFFAGLYFLYRWPILLVYMTTTSLSTFYMTVGGITVLILALHTISQPYIKRAHNIIDALLLTDLVLINNLSFLNYYRTRLNEKNGSTVVSSKLQLVLIYLPLAIMGIHILVVLYRHLHKKGCKVKKTFVPERARRLRELVMSMRTLDEDLEQDDNEELPHRLQAGDINYAYFEDSD